MSALITLAYFLKKVSRAMHSVGWGGEAKRSMTDFADEPELKVWGDKDG